MFEEERGELVAQLVAASGCSCDDAEALLVAHDWNLNAAIAHALGADAAAQGDLERAAGRSNAHVQEQLDRDIAAALAASSSAIGGTHGRRDAVEEQKQLYMLQQQERKSEAEWLHRQSLREAEFWQSKDAAKKALGAQEEGQTFNKSTTASPLPDNVKDFLQAAGLQQFLENFAAHGYDEMDIIRLMGNAEMEEVGLKGGHKLKLREALRQTGTGSGSTAAAAPAAAAAAAAAAATAEDAHRISVPMSMADPSSASATRGLTPAVAPTAVGRGAEAAAPPSAEQTPSLGAWPEDAAGNRLGEGSQSKSSAATACGTANSSSGLQSMLRGQGRGKPQQRRYIKDGKIMYMDE